MNIDGWLQDALGILKPFLISVSISDSNEGGNDETRFSLNSDAML